MPDLLTVGNKDARQIKAVMIEGAQGRNRLDEVAVDRGLRERGLFYRMVREDGHEVPQINTGVCIDGKAKAPRRPPPALAEHGAEVLRCLLGKSDDEIARLRAAGII